VIKEILASFLTTVDFKEIGSLEHLLNQFERSKYFYPKKWSGGDGYPKLPYDRNQMIDGIKTNGARYIPHLWGGKNNSFEIILFIDPPSIPMKKRLNYASLRVKYLPSKIPIYDVFQFNSDLMEVFKPEIASLQYIQKDIKDSKWVLSTLGNDIQEFGVPTFGIRTWIGQHTISQIGLNYLESCGANLKVTNWGGMEIDLIDSPWDADLPTLIEAQQRVMANLTPSGAFGDYSRYPFYPAYVPASKWTPIPLD
jgi:hypothetical protein